MVLTNVYGAALTIRAAYDALRRDARATCCSPSRSPAAARCPGSLYSATKHAVTAMGEAARQDFNDTGVRVTLIEPGHGRHAVLRRPAADRGARSRTTSPARSCSPCSSRRTSTSTRS